MSNTNERTTGRGRRMGVSVACYVQHLGRDPGGTRPFADALAMLRHAHEVGAGGAQLEVAGWDPALAAKIRSFAEEHALHVEGQVVLPRDPADRDRFARDLASLRQAGGDIARVVFLSGRADAATRARAMEIGAVDVLAKPVGGAELLDAVARALERDRVARAERAQATRR